eukprot:COSAG02_NODE_5128_length_4607_cov_32.448364_4_plen_60_part_00
MDKTRTRVPVPAYRRMHRRGVAVLSGYVVPVVWGRYVAEGALRHYEAGYVGRGRRAVRA